MGLAETISKFGHSMGSGARKHSPEILTGLGLAGTITAAVLAVMATPKAIKKIQIKENEKNDDLTPMETVKVAWKCYIPAAATEAVSIACIVGASATNYKRNAALTAAVSLSETALREYRQKVVETIGEKKEQAIRDTVNYDRLENHPIEHSEVIFTGKGKTRCYDTISNLRFESDIEYIRKSINNLNERMINGEMYMSLNDYFSEIGLPQSNVIGDTLGWNVNMGLIDVSFSSLIDEDGIPCLVIDHLSPPKYDYR